uniref:Uncharacterized protein n=1 Tax=Pan troglodytes TaxID=9598 RepID=G2HJE4_PANTR|nr:hypothetical protein [Pan troglodytes]
MADIGTVSPSPSPLSHGLRKGHLSKWRSRTTERGRKQEVTTERH